MEQLTAVADGRVSYQTASADVRGYTLRRHVVHDERSEDFRDVSEFAPVDEDEYRNLSTSSGQLIAAISERRPRSLRVC